jgi:hypothetical protein
MRWIVFALALLMAGVGAFAAEPVTPKEIAPILENLGAKLVVKERPTWKRQYDLSTPLTLIPQIDAPGAQVVSFGLPLPPDVVTEDKRIRVLTEKGDEIPAITRPLAYWWIDGKKGTLRSIQVQFEMIARLCM